MTPLLATNRSIFGHEFALQAEKTFADTADTCMRYAHTPVLLWKVMDQAQYMAVYDIDPRTGRAYPEAIGGTASWQAAVAAAAAVGVTLVPWVVPGHRNQAIIHAAFGPRLVIDGEPYRSFWTDPAADFAGYIDDLIGLGVTELYISTDPRRTAENALDETLIAGKVAGWLPQVYWTDFQQAPVPTVSDMLDAYSQLGGVVIPVLPFDGYGDFETFYQTALNKGCPSACLWKFGSANAASLQAFAQLQPAPPVDPCADQVASLQQQVQSLANQLTAAQDTVAGRQILLDQIAALAAQ